MNQKTKGIKRKLEGVVVSDKSLKTIVVKVTRRYMHPKYSKYVFKTWKYHAHDNDNVAKIGDRVQIIEARPFSKMKKWELLKVI